MQFTVSKCQYFTEVTKKSWGECFFSVYEQGNVSRVQQISKYETENIWNINFSQNKNKRRYPEQLYRLGMFMFWQIAAARPLSSASLTCQVSQWPI